MKRCILTLLITYSLFTVNCYSINNENESKKEINLRQKAVDNVKPKSTKNLDLPIFAIIDDRYIEVTFNIDISDLTKKKLIAKHLQN